MKYQAEFEGAYKDIGEAGSVARLVKTKVVPVPGAQPWEVGTTTVVTKSDFNIVCFPYDSKYATLNKTNMFVEKFGNVMSGVFIGYAAIPSGVDPTVNDVVETDGKTYTIWSIDELNPAGDGAIMWTLYLKY